MKGEGLGDYPRSCTVCGRPIRITGTAPLTFEWTPAYGNRSWHTACRKRCTATEAQARCRLEQGHTGPHRWNDIR